MGQQVDIKEQDKSREFFVSDPKPGEPVIIMFL